MRARKLTRAFPVGATLRVLSTTFTLKISVATRGLQVRLARLSRCLLAPNFRIGYKALRCTNGELNTALRIVLPLKILVWNKSHHAGVKFE